MSVTQDPSRLQQWLNNSKLQNSNKPLYQIIQFLIGGVRDLNDATTNLVEANASTSTPSSTTLNPSTVLGRRSTSAGSPEQITLGQNLAIVGTVISATGMSSRQFWQYRAKTGATSGYPGNGFILWNNATQTSATALLFSHLTDDNIDIDRILSFLTASTKIILQDADASSNFQEWLVTGSLTNTNPGTPTSYWTAPVSLITSGGTGTSGFPNNHQLVAIAFTPASGQADYVVLSDGHNPPTPVDDGAGNFIYVGYAP